MFINPNKTQHCLTPSGFSFKLLSLFSRSDHQLSVPPVLLLRVRFRFSLSSLFFFLWSECDLWSSLLSVSKGFTLLEISGFSLKWTYTVFIRDFMIKIDILSYFLGSCWDIIFLLLKIKIEFCRGLGFIRISLIFSKSARLVTLVWSLLSYKLDQFMQSQTLDFVVTYSPSKWTLLTN